MAEEKTKWRRWRVVATQMGQYNQVLIEPWSVFDLLCYADGSYPVAVRYVPRRKDGLIVPGEFDEVQLKMKVTGELVHRDYAEDQGDRLVKDGPKKGEVMRVGWMRRVPERVRLGIYPVGTDFWTKGMDLPMPRMMIDPVTGMPTGIAFQAIPQRGQRGYEEPKRNHAPILDYLPDPQIAEELEEFMEVDR